MVLANMANPPEHDFAPAWLKIPSNQQQSSKPPLVNHSGHGGRHGPPDEPQDRYKSRHYSTDSQYGYGRSPSHDQFGGRGRDENRHYSNANNRHHSVDSLPWDPDPTAHWHLSQFNVNPSSTYGKSGYPHRGSSVPRNGPQQYSNNGRFDGSGFASSRGQYQQGKPAGTGRQRYNSGPKSGYAERDEHGSDTPTKDEGQGEGADDAGKESDNKSALSNQDFPSLSGTGDDVEISSTMKTSIPSGAWEKPPGTNTKVISGRKLQLIKKSIPSASESKSTPRTITPSSTADASVGSKVIGQNGSSGQTPKLLVSTNGSSSVVLKSMTSVTPMVSSRSKDSVIRSAPVPSSRNSPVPSKPSPVPSKPSPVPSKLSPVSSNLSPVPILIRSTPADTNPSPVTKAQSTVSSTKKVFSTNSAVSTPATPSPKPSVVSSNSISQEASQVVTDVSNADMSSSKIASTSITSNAVSDSVKIKQSAPKPVKHVPASVTTTKVTSTTKSASPVAPSKTPISKSSTPSSSKPTFVSNMSSTLTPTKPTTITKMATLTPSKPTSVTNMSSTLNSKPSSQATRLASTLNRSNPVGGRSAPGFGRPSPVSSTRPSVTIINRPIPAPTGTGGSVPVTLRSGSAGSSNSRKEKSTIPVHTSTMKLLTKEPSAPPPLPSPTASLEKPCPSPTTPKPKKGDKLVFLNTLRRSSNGDLSKEVAQNNEENLRENDADLKMNGPTTQPKRIMRREHQDIKTNGIDIHHDFTTFEKGSEEDNIPNFYPVFSPVKDVPDMSSSLEAEKRLLQEMGWHEHSDNEEGYAPLTEDELKEFKKRSQQVKKNGLTRALPATWNSGSLPICSMAQVSLDDGFTSSDSDSSDDEKD